MDEVVTVPPVSHTRVTARAARILVVEDDDSSRTGLERLLQHAGYDVACARHAEEALRLAQDQRFEVVLADVNLPAMNGYQLTSELRRDPTHRHVPIILVSAVADSRRRVAGLDGGADDFIAKPVDADELLARIRLHLRHAARERELSERCRYDAVTGVLNRYGIDDELRREHARSCRTGAPLSLLMVDIDGFKAINDDHGHATGDEALRQTGVRLQSLLRVSDRLGRYGGDEFVVILPDTTSADAEALRERLRRAWEVAPARVVPPGIAVEISIGSATATSDEPIEVLVTRADQAMYANKRLRQSAVPPSRRRGGSP